MIRDSDSTESVESDPQSEPTPEELLALLERPLRRRVILHLDSDAGSVALSDLAERVATDRDPDDVATALHHNHLPRMADYGLVEYDYRNNFVTPTFREGIESYLDWFEN